MRRAVLLFVFAASLPGIVAWAQSEDCEHPIKDLASCPACPSSTALCRKPVDGYKPPVNGCGPESFSKLGLLGVIPQGYLAADFANGGCPSSLRCGCNKHDECYGTCNKDKKACDDTFLQDLLKSCQNAYPVDPRGKDGCSDGLCFSANQELGVCSARAETYYNAVATKLGQAAYDDAQKDACQCCCNPLGGALIAFDRASPVAQAGPVCKPPKLQGTAHYHAGDISGGSTDSVLTMDMPSEPQTVPLYFPAMGSFHIHYENTDPNCTGTAPDIDGSLTPGDGAVFVFLASRGIGDVAYEYSGTIEVDFDLPVTFSCPGGTQVITFHEAVVVGFPPLGTHLYLDDGTGTGSETTTTQQTDWSFTVSGL